MLVKKTVKDRPQRGNGTGVPNESLVGVTASQNWEQTSYLGRILAW